MGPDYALKDGEAEQSPAQFDLADYMALTTVSIRKRVQWQLQAKEA